MSLPFSCVSLRPIRIASVPSLSFQELRQEGPSDTCEYQLLRSVYTNLFRSPLRHVPGPLLAKLTPAWLLAVDFSGKRPHVVHRLHQRYGPVVRVAPNELAFATAAAVRDIYVGVDVTSAAAAAAAAADDSHHSSTRPPPNELKKTAAQSAAEKGPAASSSTTATAATTTTTKTFPKSDRYAIARRPNVSTMRDEAEHRARVRRIGHSFSTALLPDMEPIMRAEIAHLLRQLEDTRGAEVDALHMFRSLALDVTGILYSHLFCRRPAACRVTLRVIPPPPSRRSGSHCCCEVIFPS